MFVTKFITQINVVGEREDGSLNVHQFLLRKDVPLYRINLYDFPK